MKLLATQYRLFLPVLIIAAFFIPAYHNISGFNFISLALAEPKGHADISQTDALIIILPLVFIPLSALLIFIRSYLHLPTRMTVVVLPFLFLVFFIALLPFSRNINRSDLSFPKILFTMQIGFYVVAISSLLLIFTKNYRKKKVRKVSVPDDLVSKAAIV